MTTSDSSARLSRDDLVRAYEGYGRSRERWLIGGEFERHLLDGAGLPAPYDGPYGVRELLERFIAEGWRPSREGAAPIALTRNGASITLEPGAQFELSGRPHRSVTGVVEEARAFAEDVDRLTEDGPYRQVALGFTPWARIPDIAWVPKGRYVIMRAHMARTGDLGHHMMKGTAATQASFDFSDEADCAHKMWLAATLAPLITAMFANSPYSEGRLNGFQSFRGHVWTRTDPARTGFPAAAVDFSWEHWVDYLLDVPMMFTRIGGAWQAAKGRSFRDWMRDGIDGAYPTDADWDLHLTSVFPEVRVKQQIEVRMADCVPMPMAAAFLALWEGLFYCGISMRQAEALGRRFERFGTREERFDRACRHGLRAVVGGRPLAAWAEELVTSSREGLARCNPSEVHWLDPLVDHVEHGETPADRLVAALGPEPSVDALRTAVHPLG